MQLKKFSDAVCTARRCSAVPINNAWRCSKGPISHCCYPLTASSAACIVAGQLGRRCSVKHLRMIVTHFGFGRAKLLYGCARQEVLQLDCCCSLLGVDRRFSSWPMQRAVQVALRCRSVGLLVQYPTRYCFRCCSHTSPVVHRSTPLAALSFPNIQFTGAGLQFVLVVVDAIPTAVQCAHDGFVCMCVFCVAAGRGYVPVQCKIA